MHSKRFNRVTKLEQKLINKENDMPFIEIITDSKSQAQLNKVITKRMINNCEVLYIKDKNVENTKNIKFETLILNRSIENKQILDKILSNSKHVILNLDLNTNIDKNMKKSIISFGYNSQSDITVSSVEEDQVLIYIQHTITSIYNRKIEPQEIKINVKSDISVYNIMIIIALTSLYAR